MKTFWNELVETWKAMWKEISTSWHNKEPLMGWLPRKLGMMYVGLLLFGVLYMTVITLFYIDTPMHRFVKELLGQSAILFIVLMWYPTFQSKIKLLTQKKHWLILCISIICIVIGLGTQLVNAWTDAPVIVPALGLFLIPGYLLFAMWVHGVKPRRI